MSPFDFITAHSEEEAIHLLARHGQDCKLIAGGTGLLNLMKPGLVKPHVLISIDRISSLHGVALLDRLEIGAITTLYSLQISHVLSQAAPVLQEACSRVATIRIRAAATLGGAVAHADPQLDTLPALLALDASVFVRSIRGSREIALKDFFTGFYESKLEPDELVVSIKVRRQVEGAPFSFVKFTPNTADDYATVSVCVSGELTTSGVISRVRVALGSVASTPVRAEAVEAALVGGLPSTALFSDAAARVLESVDPFSTPSATREYKRSMAVVHTRRALENAFKLKQI